MPETSSPSAGAHDVARATSGATRLQAGLWRSARAGVAREVALVAAAILAYFGIRNRTAGSPGQALANADRIVDLERWLHIPWEHAAQASIVGSDVLVMLVNWVYIWGHWPVILGSATALYLYRRDRYYLLRNALFVSGAIGFLFFAMLPVAPPRLVESELVDTVTEQSSAYRALQPPGLTNQYAAFPSLHVGWNIVVGIVLLLSFTHLAVRALAILSPTAMAFAVVATANHYVLDVVAGMAVVLVGLAVALSIERRDVPAATLAARGSEARLVPRRRRAAPVPRGAPCGQPARRPRRSAAPARRAR
jgi:hypothetical protein